MNQIIITFLLVFLSSCSSIKSIHGKKSNQVSPDQVELNLEGTSGVSTETTPVITPIEETVRLGERGGDIYSENEATEINQVIAKKLRIGLALGPGLYRTINYVALLKHLERKSLTPQLITGTGFGAIVAAMYAHGMTPEMIEWNFYRYFREKGNHRPYEEEWYEDIDRLLLEKLKNKMLQDSSKKFYLTLYNARTKKTYYFDKGNTRDLLLKNLQLTHNGRANDKSTYTAAFENEVFNARLMNRLGADFSMGADVLGNKFDFEDSSEFLVGIYGKAAGRIAREKKSFDYFFSLPVTQNGLDSTQNGASSMMKTQEYLKTHTAEVKKLMQKKLTSGTQI